MFQRLLIERMEHRILVGILAFLGIMVLTGWIAINEGGRMRAFEQEFLARSIERGALMFASNCAPCHGPDGRGMVATAPGLNSPHMFGHDFFNDINTEVTALEAERGAEGTTQERIAAIDQRLSELETERANLTAQLQTAIDRGYRPDQPNRLAELGWGGGLETFVYTTLIHGRPTSSSYWPRPMPAWSQLANGPMRNDQLRDLTNYVLNWDKGNNWTLEDLLAVEQFAILPQQPGVQMAGGAEPAGTDVNAIVAAFAETPGDPVEGQALYTSQGCAGCHETGGAVAPPREGTWTRTVEERITLPEFEGYTPEMYIVESIVDPHRYLVPGYGALMPDTFDDRLTVQQIASLVEYLRSQDQPAG